MTTFGLDGKYILSIDILAEQTEDKSDILNSKNQIFQSTANRLSSMTLSEIKSTVKGIKSLKILSKSELKSKLLSIPGLPSTILSQAQSLIAQSQAMPSVLVNEVKSLILSAQNLPDSVKRQVKSIGTDYISVSSLLDGFENYKASSIWDMKSLMTPDTLKTVLSSCISRVANKVKLDLNSIKSSVNSLNVSVKQLSGMTEKLKGPKTYKPLNLGISDANFRELVIQEYIGLSLPIYRLVFIINDRSLLKYINNSAKIKIGFGNSENNMITFNGNIFKVEPTNNSDKIVLTIHGYLDISGYYTDEQQFSFTGTSLDVLNQVLPNYGLILNTNISQTNDEMTWKMYNTSLNNYLINLWKHSFIDLEHQICTSITTEGHFNFTDIQTKRDKQLKQLKLNSQLTYKTNSYLSDFGSNVKQKYVYDSGSNSMTLLNLDESQGLVATKVSPQTVGNKISGYGILSENMHSNWYQAEMLNRSKLFNCLLSTSWTMVMADWGSYNVTDVVETQSLHSQDAGKFLITGKMACIRDRDFNIYLQLGRETFPESSGSYDVQHY